MSTIPQWKSLDLQCAEWAVTAASKLSDKSETLVNSAASVLAKQGPFAMAVFLAGKVKRFDDPEAKLLAEIAKALKDIAQLTGEVAAAGAEPRNSGEELRAILKKASENIDNLLLARKVLQQCLVYLRSQVKALP
jgi:hypothetical protein